MNNPAGVYGEFRLLQPDSNAARLAFGGNVDGTKDLTSSSALEFCPTMRF